LGLSATQRHVRTALGRRFAGAYRYGSFKQIGQCGRLSRIRIKCSRVSWASGDIGYRGSVTIWYDNDDNGDVSWNYALKIKRTNYYCVVRKRAGDRAYVGKRCTKTYQVR
jgi:hypothetical protein